MSGLGLARAVARVLRGPLVKWRAYWDVDHRATNFVPRAEMEAHVEREKLLYDAAVQRLAHGHASSDVLPRVRLDWSKGLRSIQLQPRDAALRGDLIARNPLAFHLLFGAPVVIALLAWWAFLWFIALGVEAAPPANDSRRGAAAQHGLANRTVLNKRLQILEERADIRRGGDATLDDVSGGGGAGAAEGEPAVAGGVRDWLRDAAARLLLNAEAVQTINTGAVRKYERELAAARDAKARAPRPASDAAAAPAASGGDDEATAGIPSVRGDALGSEGDAAALARRIEALEDRLRAIAAAADAAAATRDAAAAPTARSQVEVDAGGCANALPDAARADGGVASRDAAAPPPPPPMLASVDAYAAPQPTR